MEVRPAKAERTNPRAARGLAVVHPRARLGHHVKRALGEVRAGVRRFHMQGRGQHTGVQRGRDLDHTGATGGGLGMADHGFDRAHAAELFIIAEIGEGLGKALNFGAVTDHGAGAMRLNQTDGRGRHTGALIGTDQGGFLPFGARRGQRQVLAIRRAPNPAQHGVDAVAIGLGLIHLAQDQHCQTLGNRDPVGARVKRAAATPLRQGAGFREGQEIERVLETVRPAHNRHVRRAVFDLTRGHHDGGKRRATGRIDGKVHAAKVEPVGDPPRNDVQQNAWEAILGPFGQARLGGLGHAPVDRRHGRTHGIALPQRPRATAHPDDHRGAFAQFGIGDMAVFEACVFQCLTHGFQRQQLQRFNRGHGIGRNAVFDRVEFHLIKEPAPTRINLVRRIAVFVVIPAPVPTTLGHFFDRVDAVQNVFPVGVEVRGLGQFRPETGDGDIRARPFGDDRCDARLGHGAVQNRTRGDANPVVQIGNRGRLIMQVRHLPDHVNAQTFLILIGHGDQTRRAVDLAELGVAIHAFGRDARAAHVEFLKRVLDRVGVHVLTTQVGLDREKLIHNGAFDHAGRVTGAGFKQHRA